MSAITSDQPASTQQLPASKQFQCGTCKKRYSRVDHLARHVRSHTNSRPYQCKACPKAFARADLLKRHAAAHTTGPESAAKRPAPTGQPGGRAPPSRVTSACKECAACHLRCSETKPCTRCTARAITCSWNQPDEGGAEQAPDSPSIHKAAQIGTPVMQTFQNGNSAAVSQEAQTTLHVETGGFENQWSPLQDSNHISWGSSTLRDVDQPELGNCPLDLSADLLELLPGQWTPMGGVHVDLTASLELDDIDLRFLDSYNTNVPFELESGDGSVVDSTGGAMNSVPSRPFVSGARTGSDNQDHGHEGDDEANRPVTIRTNAFRNSHWRFHPSSQNHCAEQEHNLSLPVAGNVATDGDQACSATTSPESRITLERYVTHSRLTAVTRDKILAVILDNCSPGNLERTVSSFPSVDLLDTLIQFYLTSPVKRADNFIHFPSFDPNEKRPQLLVSMAAAGAALTGDPALVKLGYAIHECVRHAVSKLWERDNSLTRDLQLSQAWMIYLEEGIWSGHSRKVEIAESFFQPLVTMLRRNARFRRSGYTNETAADLCQAQDSGNNSSESSSYLTQRWHVWVQEESFKRLVFRVFTHDAFVSMALLVPPIISYAEMGAPRPSCEALWAAPTPEAWKRVSEQIEEDRKAPSSTLMDLLDEPELIAELGRPADVALASHAYLSCAWRLTWEYLQLNSLQRKKTRQRATGGLNLPDASSIVAGNVGGSTRWSTFLLSSRRDELIKLLDHLRMAVSNGNMPPPKIAIRLEHTLMHLHTPFEEIQVFAGMEGREEARAITGAVTDWARDKPARRAVWHAGQVLRATKSISSGQVAGTATILAYHASLVLWAYGSLLSRFQRREGARSEKGSSAASNIHDEQVWLDGEETMAAQKFIEFGRGAPAIRGFSATEALDGVGSSVEASLHRPDLVMEAFNGILLMNHRGKLREPLVDNLLQLVRELKKSSGHDTDGN